MRKRTLHSALRFCRSKPATWLSVIGLLAVMSAVHSAGPPHVTKLSGQIDKDTVWSGRVEVSNHVSVAAGVTLVIKPGTRVAFADGVGLSVHGQLLAEGTEDKPITLVPLGKLRPDAWRGVVLAPRSHATAGGLPEGSRLSGCHIAGALEGLSIIASAASPHRVVACRFEKCERIGVRVEATSDVVVEGCQITHCGHVERRPSGAIHVSHSRHCRIVDNVIEDCAAYGVQLYESSDNTVQGNTIKGIGGRSRKPDGMDISLDTGSNRNLVLSNKVSGMNYMCLYIGNSAENLIIDNELRNSPDGLGMSGPKSTRNIIRSNRIYGSWWGQIYFTSRAHDNLVQDLIVSGGDAGITMWYAGPNTFENCEFRGCGPIAFLGGVKVTFRRCKIQLGRGNDDLWTEFEPDCTLIDCNVRKDHIDFSKGTTKNSQIVFKRTFVVIVVDEATGKPVPGASVTATVTGKKPLAVTTDSVGRARLELFEGTVGKDRGFEASGSYEVVVKANGFAPAQPLSIEPTSPITTLRVSLKPQ